jgi:hypothetical protein
MLSSLQTLLKKQAARILPIGAVTGVLGFSLVLGGAGIVGAGTGYGYGGSACTSANVSAAPASPQLAGVASVVLTGSSTTCSHPEYQFYTQTPGGPWTAVTASYMPWNGTSTATVTWNTSALPPGTYGIGVWARNSGSTAVYEAYATATFDLSGNCSTASITPSVPSPAQPGQAVTFTATAAGCASAEFRYWLTYPGGAGWIMVRDYGASTWNWPAGATTLSTQGTYLIGVWARAVGSPNAYDSYAYLAYVLKNTCDGGVALSASPASPSKATTVTFTAAATGCSGALYQFYELAPGGTWTSVQAFSTTATLTFNAATATNGQYMFGVWAKGPTSSKAYDSYAIITFYVGT